MKETWVDWEALGELLHAPQISQKPCPTNQLEEFAEVSEQVDKGDPADVIFPGFQKTLTTLFCQRLLKKLNSNGRRRKVLVQKKDGLNERKQGVGLNGLFPE